MSISNTGGWRGYANTQKRIETFALLDFATGALTALSLFAPV
jgi:hypothetical protein